MISEQEYNSLAHDVYDVDQNKTQKPVREGQELIVYNDKGKELKRYEVLKIHDNGM